MKAFSYPESKAGGPFEFGWESEFPPSEAALLLDRYEPLEGAWEKNANRVDWLKQKISSAPLGDRSALLRRSAHANPKLPELAYRDDTGNIEVRSGPVATLAEAMDSLTLTCNEIGRGSLQLTISQPTERFFQKGAASAEEHLGWLTFFTELDVFDRLARGQEWRRSGFQGELTRNFLHPFLGPLNRRRKKMLKEYIRENAAGNMWGSEDLFWAGRKDRSFKFVGGTAYRPDIAGPARVCFEVRDAHKDLALLEARARRVLFYWSKDLASFAAFADLPAFDLETDFDPLSPELRAFLEQVFPCRAPMALREFRSSLKMHEVYRNFAYPLREWGEWLNILGVSASDLKVHQDKYRATLEKIMGEGSPSLARVQAQDALSRFADESPLYPALLAKEKELAHGK